MTDNEFPMVHTALLAIAFNRCRNHATSEDVVSDTVLALLPRMLTLSVSEYTALAITMVKGKLVDVLRKSSKCALQEVSEAALAEFMVDYYALPFEEELNDVLNVLTGRQINIVKHLIVGDKSPDIMEALAIGKTTYYEDVRDATHRVAEATA